MVFSEAGFVRVHAIKCYVPHGSEPVSIVVNRFGGIQGAQITMAVWAGGAQDAGPEGGGELDRNRPAAARGTHDHDRLRLLQPDLLHSGQAVAPTFVSRPLPVLAPARSGVPTVAEGFVFRAPAAAKR